MAVETDDVGPEWDGIQPQTKGGGGAKKKFDGVSLFMRCDPRPEPYNFRLACTPIRFRKHGWAFRMLKQWPISPATDPSEKDLDIAWKDGYFMPATKYAALVFDRDNGNRLRVLEGPPDIFGPIGNDAHMNKMNPASPTKGWDWIVQVTEEVEGDRKVRKYSVAVNRGKGATPLTSEELKILENPKFTREELEKTWFKKSTPEEIKDMWDQLPPEARLNPKRGEKGSKGGQQKVAQVAPQAAPAAAATPAAKPATQAPAKPVAAAPKPAPAPEPAPETDNSFLNEDPTPDSEPAGDDQPARLF